MDLKSSSLEFCKQNAVAVPRAKVEFSSGWTSSSLASFPGNLARFALLALIALLPVASALAQSADKLPARVDLSVTTIEGPSRTQATFTARVVGSDGNSANEAAPTGSVSFMIGDRSIGSAYLDADGRATYTADALPLGLQKITAVYPGDEGYQAASSIAQAVNSQASGLPSFTLSANATTLSVPAGQTATAVITATPENGFNQAVSLSCSGVPYATVTCVFSPASVTPGPPTSTAPNGTPALSTLSVQTIAPSGASLRDLKGKAGTAYAMVIPGILALAGLGLARKRAYGGLRLAGLFALLLAGGLGLGACSQRYGYFHKPPAGNPGTPTGTYTLVVTGITGTGSTLSTASVQFTFTVTGAS
jgi:hypothetical protein